jgi:hypothetical protein
MKKKRGDDPNGMALARTDKQENPWDGREPKGFFLPISQCRPAVPAMPAYPIQRPQLHDRGDDESHHHDQAEDDENDVRPIDRLSASRLRFLGLRVHVFSMKGGSDKIIRILFRVTRKNFHQRFAQFVDVERFNQEAVGPGRE